MRNLKNIHCAALFLFLAFAPGLTRAGSKPLIAVQFKIDAVSYHEHFRTALPAIEQEITAILVKALNKNICFSHFVEAPSPHATYTLTMSLNVPNPRVDDSTQQVWLYALLSANSSAASGLKKSWVLYSHAPRCLHRDDPGCRFPEQQDFKAELRNTVLDRADYANLAENVLTEVSILDSGSFVTDPAPGWALPISQAELCLDQSSMLRIKDEIEISGTIHRRGTFDAEIEGTLPPASTFAGFWQSVDDPEKQNEELLRTKKSDKVNSVSVRRYQPLRTSAEPPPTAPALTGGSQ